MQLLMVIQKLYILLNVNQLHYKLSKNLSHISILTKEPSWSVRHNSRLPSESVAVLHVIERLNLQKFKGLEDNYKQEAYLLSLSTSKLLKVKKIKMPRSAFLHQMIYSNWTSTSAINKVTIHYGSNSLVTKTIQAMQRQKQCRRVSKYFPALYLII